MEDEVLMKMDLKLELVGDDIVDKHRLQLHQ